MLGPEIFSFKVLESPGKVLEFCSVISVATLCITYVIVDAPLVILGVSGV